MTAPTIDIVNVSRNKIGNNAAVDKSLVTFRFNQVLSQFEARADGSGPGQGLLVEQATNLIPKPLNTLTGTLEQIGQDNQPSLDVMSWGESSFYIDDEELAWGDKNYHINIYGKNEAGEWTSYGNLLGSNASFEEGLWSSYGSTAGTLSLVPGSFGSSQAARIEMVADGVKGLKSSVNFSLNEGDIVTVSFLARGNRSDVILNYIYFMSDIVANSSVGTVTLNTEWLYYEIEWIVPSGRSANDYDILMALYSGRRGVVIGDWVELDDVWITKEGV